jgi:hypothetical protein
MDLGGELGSCPEVVNFFKKSVYKVETTAAQSSNQNGTSDNHKCFAEYACGTGLPAKVCPYAFWHYQRIYNLIPCVGKDQSCWAAG